MRIGIDLGGTKTEIIALDDSGRELLRERTPTPSQSYDAIVSTIAQLVEGIESRLGSKGSVGIGIPGAVSPTTGLVKNANTTCLIGRAFDRDLAVRLSRPIRIANDANCFVLSEATDGAAAGAEVVFGVILGTGTGGGLTAFGRLLVGKNAITGEWGHNPLPWPRKLALGDERPGPKCYCGKNGCIETFLSGPGLRRDHLARTGDDLLPQLIDERARAGDVACEATLALFDDRLARSLATVIDILDPDVVVFGGGLSNLERIYINVPKLLPLYVFSDQVATELVRAKHGDSSGVRGAAWLW
jgi:fructokinase